MRDAITIETDLFGQRQPRPRPNLPRRGDDVASWLLEALRPLRAAGFELSEPVQKDFGWGLWAVHRTGPFWVAISYCGHGSTQEEPAQWVVSVSDEPDYASPLFHARDAQVFSRLRDEIWTCMGSTPGIRILGSVH